MTTPLEFASGPERNGSLTADRLKLWRVGRGMSQTQAARWYGTSERTWRRWERAEQPIPPHVQRRFAGIKFPAAPDTETTQDTEP